jgi:hypothetical protein
MARGVTPGVRTRSAHSLRHPDALAFAILVLLASISLFSRAWLVLRPLWLGGAGP